MGSVLNDIDRSEEKTTFLKLSTLLCCVSKNSIELSTIEEEGIEMLEGGLETDAVPLPGRSDDIDEDDRTPSIPNVTMEMERMNTQDSGFEVMTNYTSSTTNTEIMERRSSSTSQNGISSTTNVANTQGAVVMQFSNIQGLHIGAVNNINLHQPPHQAGQQSKNNDESRKTRRTRTIENMMHCNEEVDEKMLTNVSAHLGEGWQFVMRELGQTDALIEQTNMDYSIYGVKEVECHCLIVID